MAATPTTQALPNITLEGRPHVTIRVAGHPPRERELQTPREPVTTQLLTTLDGGAHKSKRVIRSSIGSPPSTYIAASKNGFAHAAIDAYNSHHHLVLRPEDVFFAIVNQVGLYVAGNAEAVRDIFVEHQGKKELVVVMETQTVETTDLGEFALRMQRVVQENIKNKEFVDWTTPRFSTTTRDDQVVSAFLTMASLKAFFSYGCMLACGIPSVTLLGTREDWVELRRKADYLPALGRDVAMFQEVLIPVLDYFVKSYEEPNSPEVTKFWGRIADIRGVSGPSYLSGWITAFMFWDKEGRRRARFGGQSRIAFNLPLKLDDSQDPKLDQSIEDRLAKSFGTIDMKYIPDGYSTVSVVVVEFGKRRGMTVVVGSIGIEATSSGDFLDTSHNYHYGKKAQQDPNRTGLDTLQPVSGWLMVEEKEAPTAGFEEWVY